MVKFGIFVIRKVDLIYEVSILAPFYNFEFSDFQWNRKKSKSYNLTKNDVSGLESTLLIIMIIKKKIKFEHFGPKLWKFIL